MLINLSNNPSTAWSESQKVAAQEQFGEIVDWAFPNISPNATAEEVAQLAEDYFQRIAQLTPRPSVYLMGDMTFTFALVLRLLAAGVLYSVNANPPFARRAGWVCVLRS